MQVELSVMYSERAPTVVALEVRQVPVGVRASRASMLFIGLLLVGAVVTVLPLLHVCGAATVLVASPVAAWLAWKTKVVTVGEQQVVCPKCTATVAVAAARSGWPIRLQCEACGASLSAGPARP
jgi:ribosomal protein S27AE